MSALTNGSTDVVVIGAGVAGLVAAARVARSGRSVIVLEQSRHPGGRAATTLRDDVAFNLGPRALFCEGHAFLALKNLGIPFRGAFPNPGHSQLTFGPRRFRTPAGLGSLAASRLFSIREKLRLAKFQREAAKVSPKPLMTQSIGEWVADYAGNGPLARFLHALFRLSTYGNDVDHLSAGATLEQFQMGRRGNVWYIDGGWQSLADGLRRDIESRGGQIRTGVHIDTLQSADDKVEVRCSDGHLVNAEAAILAATPEATSRLLRLKDTHPLSRQISRLRPAYAACLDLALTALPRPNERFALGLDTPMYFSVHSAAAKLGPEGLHIMHVMKYLGPERKSPEESEKELEDWLELVQPGWRTYLHTRRFLPNMIVTHGIPLAAEGGLVGRPAVPVAHHPRVFLAGDWVGDEGQLVDASAASGETAARLAIDLIRSTNLQMSHSQQSVVV